MRELVILMPAYNEAATIAATIAEYIREFPKASLIVVDNNCIDGTSEEARKVLRPQDHLIFEGEQGKGAAMRSGFALVEAEIYLVVDADLTYAAKDARAVVDLLKNDRLDMVVGDRLSLGAYTRQNKRFGHSFGNALLTFVISIFLKRKYKDVLSGLRAFSQPFIHSTTIRASGFQVETELNISAAYLNAKVAEIPITYGERPDGSVSKLDTFTDGFRILYAAIIGGLQVRPMIFFSILSTIFLALSILGGSFIFVEYIETGQMRRIGLALISASLGLLASLCLFSGLILSVVGQAVRDLRISRMHEMKRRWLNP